MKNKVIAAVMLGMVFFATPALAKNHENNHEDDDDNRGGLRLGIKNWFNFDSSQFVVAGTIQSVSANSIVVKVLGVTNVPNVTNSLVTVKVDSNTKFSGTDNATSISATSVGKSVVATGAVGADLLATKVVVNGGKVDKIEVKKKTMGSVTAKTDTSITIKNGVTGDVKTITTDANTKVKVNGEVKALADVQVGDRGWVKFKTVGTTMIAKIIRLFR